MAREQPSAGTAASMGAIAAVAPGRAQQPTPSAVNLPLPENIGGMLAYFFLPALVFLFVGPFKRNRFVRFHSLQCLLTVCLLLILHVLIAIYGKFEPILALPLYGLLLLAGLALWLLLLVKAYQHVIFKLPYIGDLAEQWACR